MCRIWAQACLGQLELPKLLCHKADTPVYYNKMAPLSWPRILGMCVVTRDMDIYLLDFCATMKMFMAAQRWYLFLPIDGHTQWMKSWPCLDLTRMLPRTTQSPWLQSLNCRNLTYSSARGRVLFACIKLLCVACETSFWWMLHLSILVQTLINFSGLWINLLLS